MLEVILKQFEEPDEVREMVKGKFERCVSLHFPGAEHYAK